MNFVLRALRLRGAFVLALALVAVAGWAQVAVPDLQRRVTDLTATLTPGETATLEGRLEAFEAQRGSQIAVLMLPTLEGEDIAQFGIRVAEKWAIGRARIDDGAILIVAKDDRQMRLEVGYGLEGAIPDAVAKRVIAEVITPHFRDGNYYAGIDAGVGQLMRLIEGEDLPPPEPGHAEGDDATFAAVVIGGVVGGWLLSLLMSRPAAGAVAALGSVAAGTLLLGFNVLLLFIAGFVFAAVLSGFRGRGGGWSSGGGGGSWGGGGGGFGGGGASGRW